MVAVSRVLRCPQVEDEASGAAKRTERDDSKTAGSRTKNRGGAESHKFPRYTAARLSFNSVCSLIASPPHSARSLVTAIGLPQERIHAKKKRKEKREIYYI